MFLRSDTNVVARAVSSRNSLSPHQGKLASCRLEYHGVVKLSTFPVGLSPTALWSRPSRNAFFSPLIRMTVAPLQNGKVLPSCYETYLCTCFYVRTLAFSSSGWVFMVLFLLLQPSRPLVLLWWPECISQGAPLWPLWYSFEVCQ